MVNVYKDTIPRFHRDPSKKKKKWRRKNKCRGERKWDQEMGSRSPQSLPTAFVQTDLVEPVLALSSHPKIWTAIFQTTSRKQFLRALKVPWPRFCEEVKTLHDERPKIKGKVSPLFRFHETQVEAVWISNSIRQNIWITTTPLNYLSSY